MTNSDFIYQANIQYPDINKPTNWFNQLYIMEDWLNQYVGKQMIDWVYINHPEKLTVGFKKPEHKTLFLLVYTK